LNLFPKAIFIAGNDIIRGDTFIDFFEKRYAIDENVKVISTPGHSDKNLSVMVKTKNGIVAIVGDLFEKEGDWKKEGTWEPWSFNPKKQASNRLKIWKNSNYIIPGHGGMFKVDNSIDLEKFDQKRIDKLKS